MSMSSDQSQPPATGYRVRMAYALNNAQPVICSLVGDQPLFYMDAKDDIDDGLAAEMAQSDEMNFEAGARSSEDSARNLSAFRAMLADMATPSQQATPDFNALMSTLSKSRFAAALLGMMADQGGQVLHDAQTEFAVYDRATGNILVNPRRDLSEQVLLATRELRRMWQHRNGALINPLVFQPDQAILVNRTQAADLLAAVIRVGWEMQLAGEKQVWQRIEHSPLADLGRAFAREAHNDFRTISEGSAATAVFEAWFLSERCRMEDRCLIQQMLADYNGYVFDTDHTSKTAAMDLVLALGSMPYGKNYLMPYVATICKDALFSEVRDRSNANFLWFIKFERTFRDAEQENGKTDGATTESHSACQTAADTASSMRDHGTADIITLPRHPVAPGGKRGAGSADIVSFRKSSDA